MHLKFLNTFIATLVYIAAKVPCLDKNGACPIYVNTYGYSRYCAAQWFVGDGRYGCKKSCNLC